MTKRKVTMIRAVILDLDNTLYAYEPLNEEASAKVREFICGQLKITSPQYEEAYKFGRNETKKRLGNVGASHNRLLYFQKTLEYFGVNPIPLSLQMYEIYWGTFLEKMSLREGAAEFMDRMLEHGIRIMVCTDLTTHIQHRKIEALGIADKICYLVTSEEAGIEKPAPEIFALCLEKLKLRPEEVCCIGDDPRKDVEGAAAAGIRAFLFRAEELSAPQFEEMAEQILQQ